MEKVDDNVENMEICKKFCGICPMFKDNQLKEAPPHALFCTQGKSTKASTAKMTGCNCPGCGLLINAGIPRMCHGKTGS